jgi:serine-type D-Ala-D-Ala carboxypeptidase (penicillin-binding protein 5/6)
MIRRAAILAATALVVAPPATALAGAPPPVRASAWLVEDARTGQVLASADAHDRVPIASITKLMTVLVALQHHKLADVVDVDPRAAAVGQSSAYLVAGERLTVRELVEAALIQSANDAADALALSVAPSFPAFAVLMNAEARRLGLRDSHFVRPDGLDAPGEYSTAADVTRLARIAMRTRFIRDTVREPTATIAGGEVLHTWDDLLSIFPPTIGVKTGHTSAAGWCQVAAARGPGVTVYATLLGSPSRADRNEDLEALLVWGLARFRVIPAVQAGRIYTQVDVGYGKQPLDLVAQKRLLAVARVGRTLQQTVLAPVAVSLPVRRGEVLGRVVVRDGSRIVGTRPLVASRTINKPGLVGRLRWYAGRALHHLAHLL